jgi:hypothetical protein
MEYFKKALDKAIYTYGQCLCKDIEDTGLAEQIERWLELSVDIYNRLDDIL